MLAVIFGVGFASIIALGIIIWQTSVLRRK